MKQKSAGPLADRLRVLPEVYECARLPGGNTGWGRQCAWFGPGNADAAGSGAGELIGRDARSPYWEGGEAEGGGWPV